MPTRKCEELENILERAVTLCSNDRVEPGDIQLKQGAGSIYRPSTTRRWRRTGSKATLPYRERAIVRALEQTRYNRPRRRSCLDDVQATQVQVKKLGSSRHVDRSDARHRRCISGGSGGWPEGQDRCDATPLMQCTRP